ncbi:MAG: CoA transferase [Dehalococcoidia bacterium]|nr:CoA transferase [Dehalococcoidia bacterium]
MDVLKGIRVIDVTSWIYVPVAGAILAHWGADVIKVEPARSPDPGRNTRAPRTANWHANRGKRGIGLDLASEEGRNILYRLVENADVFLTSYLPDTRKKLKIDVDDIRAINPRIIYARGSGRGPHGPEAGRGGYDLAVWWGRGSLAASSADASGVDFVPGMTGHGDTMSGHILAGGICAALFQRAMTGKASVVDGSLMHTAVWFNSLAINAAAQGNSWRLFSPGPREDRNPLVNSYRTKDGRWVQLCMLSNPGPEWVDLVTLLGRPDIASDPRFANAAGWGIHSETRDENQAEAVTVLDELFRQYTLDEAKERLANARGVWEAVQTPAEILEDPQTIANGFVQKARHADGTELSLTVPAVLFDGEAGEPQPGPDWGEHTDAVLSELGLTADQIAGYRERGVIH